MIRSMTAFARCEQETDAGPLTWELRSVNHRYLELGIRLPEELRSLEGMVRETVSQRLGRGKVECNLRFRPIAAADSALLINEQVLHPLLAACETLQHQAPDTQALNPLEVLRWPGVLQEQEPDRAPLARAAQELLSQAIDILIETRSREGQQIHALLSNRLVTIASLVQAARTRLPEIQQRIREKMAARLGEITATVDADRLEQEILYLVQKMDVDEELDRLEGHVEEARRVLERDDPVGRRLDFLMQEFNREANTLASKSADGETTRIAVELKVLIEQMREQVQNVE